MIGMISPALESMAETLSTVKFANRAKHIKNEAVVNEDIDQKSLLRKYEKELLRLRCVLSVTFTYETVASCKLPHAAVLRQQHCAHEYFVLCYTAVDHVVVLSSHILYYISSKLR
jgi:hypothetical protein